MSDNTNSAHGFTEGSEFKTETKEMEGKKHRPDFPEWIKSKEGEDCLNWPISEVKYLHNRLFWAFDAGRNCVWDQYIAQKSELQKAKEEVRLLKFDYQAMFDEVKRLRSLLVDFEKAKELNGDLVGYLKRIMTREIFKEHFNIEQVEELIKKSES